MRRFAVPFERKHFRFSTSYVAGLFNFKVVPAELFPYPSRKMDGEEGENLQFVLDGIGKNNNTLTNLYGTRIATEYGGLGLGHTAHAFLYEKVGIKSEEKLFSTICHGGVCTHILETIGAKDLKGKYLTAMSDGTVRMGWAVEEDGFESDISMNTTEATLCSGEGYRLSGKKRCYCAASASHFLVLAKTNTQTATPDGVAVAHRSSLFICSKDAPGLEIKGCHVFLNNTPASDVVGAIGEGFKNVMVSLFTEQHLYLTSLLGVIKHLVGEICTASTDKAVVDVVACILCDIYAMESVIYALTANMDVPTDDSLMECVLTAAFVQTTAAQWLRRFRVLMPSDKELDRSLRHAETLLSFIESRDFLYATAVCCGVEDYGLFFQKASTLQMIQARTLRQLGVYDRIPVKGISGVSLLEKAVVMFGDAVETTFVRNGSQVPYQQLLLNRLGEGASLLYAASAVASRASMCAAKRLPSGKVEGKLADAFISSSVERVRALCEETCNVGGTADDVYKRIAVELSEDAF